MGEQRLVERARSLIHLCSVVLALADLCLVLALTKLSAAKLVPAQRCAETLRLTLVILAEEPSESGLLGLRLPKETSCALGLVLLPKA